MKNIFVTFIFALFCFQVAQASTCDEFISPQEKFCKRPTDVICAQEVLQRKRKDIDLFFKSKLVSSIYKNSHPEGETNGIFHGEDQKRCLSDLENAYGFCQTANTVDKEVSSRLPNLPIASELSSKIQNEYKKLVFDRVNKDEDLLFDTYKNSIKLFFKTYKKYINKTFSENPRKAKKLIKRFKSRVKNLAVYFGPTSKSKERHGEEKSKELEKTFNKICGSDGRTKNGAITSKYDVKTKRVLSQSFIICPSNYLTYSKNGDVEISQEKMMNKLLGIMGHELGHINQDIDSANATENLSCFQRNFKNSKRMNKNFKNYHHEIEADVLSMSTMAEYLIGKSISEKIKILQDSYSGLCGTREGTEHPSGDFRLNQLLLKTPAIFNQFKCQDFHQNKLVLSCKEGSPYPLSIGF